MSNADPKPIKAYEIHPTLPLRSKTMVRRQRKGIIKNKPFRWGECIV